jgi:taurine dioxygenase
LADQRVTLVRPDSEAGVTCRFRWETGSVAVWDNRCTLHIAVNDVWKFPRLMHRVQMCGDRPV